MMLSPDQSELLVRLKEVAVRIDYNISSINDPTVSLYYHKRLQQLASAAEQKVLSLKNGEEITIAVNGNGSIG